jgi:branched-chain amino acid transport system substrate-binding protein
MIETSSSSFDVARSSSSSTYGDDVRDTSNINAMGTYTVMAALATSLDGISGDITPESVIQTIKAMPEQELPGGAAS